MSSRLHCDISRWPLVVLVAPVRWGAETVARYAEETTRCAELRQPFALVLDLTESALIPIASRELLAAHRRWLFAQAGSVLLRESVVVKSRSEREFFTVTQFDERARTDEQNARQTFCQTLDEAILHGTIALRQQGIVVDSIPPRNSSVRIRPLRKALRPMMDDTPAPPRSSRPLKGAVRG